MNSPVHVELGGGFHLTPIRDGDQPAYIEHFRDETLANALLLVPYPYTREDANGWIHACIERAARLSIETQFAIRRADGFLVGGAGLFPGAGLTGHRAELGYWLAADYRNRGIVRTAVRILVGYGFGTLGLKRIEASTDPENQASRHILEEEGFALEGLMRSYYVKNGKLLDRCLYGMIRGDTLIEGREQPSTSSISQSLIKLP